MITFIRITLRISLFILLLWTGRQSYAQTSNSQFGQNRVQYHQFEWSFYESEHFNTYFYIGGQDLGKFVIQDAEKELKDISALLDRQTRNKIDILVYTDITDANMSNIGIQNEEKNIGGTVKVLDNKIILYFDGCHEHMRQMLREGITRIFIQQIGQGSNFQEVVQNVVMSALPAWITNGLAKYIAYGWTHEDDAKFRTEIRAGRFVKFKRLSSSDAAFLGKAFWNYVVQQYGKATLSNLVYLMRINRTVESAFLFALGHTVNESINSCMKYYVTQYNEQLKDRVMPDPRNKMAIRTKKNLDYYHLELNDNGKQLAYASNDIGRQKLHLYDIEKKKGKVLLRMGFKTQSQLTDHSYPLIAWEPGGKKLAALFEKRDKIKLLFYDLEKKKKDIKPVTKFQKVFSMSYGTDRNTLLLSAMQKGQCDIFTYQINNNTTVQLTNDMWDDLDPVFINAGDQRGIMFRSNRLSDTMNNEKMEKKLPLGPYNLYFYSPLIGNGLYAKVTYQSGVQYGSQQNLGHNYYTFLGNESGISNRYIGRFEKDFWYNAVTWYYSDTSNEIFDSITLNENLPIDSVLDMSALKVTGSNKFPVYKVKGVNFPVSNSGLDILEQSICRAKGQSANLHYNGRKYEFYLEAIDTGITEFQSIKLQSVPLGREPDTKANLQGVKAQENVPMVLDKEPEPAGKYFQSDFDFMDQSFRLDSTLRVTELISATSTAPVMGSGFRYSKIQPYFVKMMTDRAAFQIDNSLLMTRYAPFNPGNPVYPSPMLGGLFKLGITELMEDHRIYGGFKIPTNLSGSEYFLTYDNVKRRLDRKLTFYHSNQPTTSNNPLVPFDTVRISPENLPLRYSMKTNYLELQMKYPFDPIQSLRFGIAYRNDKYVYKSENLQSLRLPNYTTNWVTLKLEYVFDRTFDLATNIKEGTRFRLFTEFHKEIPTKDTKIGTLQMNLPRWNNAYFGIIGADFRHYQKLYKHIILATRLSWSTSYGNRKMIYYLGGVDGALMPKFNTTTPINTEYKYAFQSIATDMRGFDQNIRNGNSFVLLNAELRVPIFSTLINSPIRSEFIRNFQLVGFTDVGTAWEGFNPFTRSNPLFKDVYQNTNVSMSVFQYRSPVVAGYGFGFRTSLFGYFLRTDLAWGYDGAKSTGPKIHFSFNMDF